VNKRHEKPRPNLWSTSDRAQAIREKVARKRAPLRQDDKAANHELDAEPALEILNQAKVLPGESRKSKVPVHGCLSVDGRAKIEKVDNRSRSHVEMLHQSLADKRFRHNACTFKPYLE